ncbi:MAG: sulfatase [Verrucomicrobia bacterium]|nr:sulfatase [Verrucomicrobiota bacterium]
MLSHRFILIVFASLLAGTLFGAVRASKPNIVFFFIDDLGRTDLGYMGSKYYESPHVDKLAKDGMVFMNAYANAPNCAPSRACLMSGKYSPRHGVYTVGNSDRGSSKHRKLIPVKNATELADEFVTIAEALKPSGYVTATMGKWHLGDDPTTQGFDVNVAGKSWGSPSGGGYHSPYKYPNLENKEKGEYLTDRLGVEACKFIETNKDKPFFLYLTHYAVHTPIQAKPNLNKKYQAKKSTERHNNAAYAAMIESMDDSVGTVLTTLDRLELADDTLVIFFSDNGGHGGVTSNAPLRGSKGMLYEGGIREPMIVKWPGVTKSGSICRENVIGIDLYPTLLEATGSPVPKGYELDGVSIAPLLRNAAAKLPRKAIHWHFPAYLQGYTARHGHFRTTPAAATRMGDWKLIEFFEDGALELYNTVEDLSETKNLAKKNPKKAEELHAAMLAWRKTVNAPVPTELNPEYASNTEASAPKKPKLNKKKDRKKKP